MPVEVKKLQRNIISLKKQLLEVKEQLKFNKQSARAEIKDIAKREQKLKKNIDKLEEENSGLKEKIKELQSEILKIKAENNKQEKAAANKEKKLLQKIDFLEISADDTNEIIEKAFVEISKLKEQIAEKDKLLQSHNISTDDESDNVAEKENYNRFFLRVQNGRIFGPTSLLTLYDWAAQCRVSPHDHISDDKKNWRIVTRVPELGIEWLVALENGTALGPVNIAAVHHLILDKEISADTVITNTNTGQALPASVILTPQFIKLHNEVMELRKKMEKGGQ